ncbi:eCIS core domain-containing protein [Deinococcus aquaedulcis]|uniref:eCIS core domain-containing protein n=1 Tax=Deinococcus aquaedulcis TaxID=2840455 RepID=UPI001F388E9E|nr:DUF4157 domain-containing protein [Deinococcus aquaedulcis]
MTGHVTHSRKKTAAQAPRQAPLTQTPAEPLAVLGQTLQRQTARPVLPQKQAAQPVLQASALEQAEVERVQVQRQVVAGQLANLPHFAAAPQHRASPLVPDKPQTPADWVTVMRSQAEQVEGRALDTRQYTHFAGLQRQVAHTLAQGFRADRGPAPERYETYGEHLATLQRHPVSAPVARVVLGMIPPGERVALQRAVDSAAQRQATQAFQEAQGMQRLALQRQLAELEAESTQPVLQRIQARRGSGNPLPEAIQRHLERGLNHDLSRVRIHDDAEADHLAKGVHAVAFTTGSDIFFQRGRFNPNTQSGLELLAHEVTHTVQQSQGRVGTGIDPDAGLEVEARTMGARLAQAMPSPKSLMPPAPHAPGAYTQKAALQRAQDGAVTAALYQPFTALGIQRQAAGITIQRNMVLNKVSDLAANIPGYRELCLAFGKDLVTGKRLDQNPNAVLDALANLVPGPFKDMLKVVRQQNLIPKTWAWFKGELGKLQLGGVLGEVKATVGKFPPDLGAAKAALMRRADGLKRLVAGSARHIAQIGLTAIEAGLGPVGKKIMGLLKQGGDVIVQVLRNPAQFAKNLLGALKQGFGQFRTNAGKWLKQGLGTWLTGASGIQFPATLDLKGVFMTALSVMGLTYQALRGRLVKELGRGGEQKIAAAEKAGGALASLTKGLHQAPELKGQQSSVGQGVVESLKGEVTRSLVTAGAAKVASMLVPGGAFVQALLTAFQGVQTLVSQSSQIMGVIMNALGSVQAIAAGQVGAAAGFIERTIGGSIPVVLTFLGKVARIGNIAPRIRATVTNLRTRLDGAIDKLIGRVKGILQRPPTSAAQGQTARGATSQGRTAAGKSYVLRLPFSMNGAGHHLVLKRTAGKSVALEMHSVEDHLSAKILRRIQSLEADKTKSAEVRMLHDVLEEARELETLAAQDADMEQMAMEDLKKLAQKLAAYGVNFDVDDIEAEDPQREFKDFLKRAKHFKASSYRKHVKGKDEATRRKSSMNGGPGQYYARFSDDDIEALEVEALNKGNPEKRSGGYHVYYRFSANIGYADGDDVSGMRAEMTDAPVPLIHSHPRKI